MGVERAVTRWYVQRQILLDEIATFEAKLANLQNQQNQQDQSQPGEQQTSGNGNTATGAEAKAETETRADIERKLAEAQERLLTLGPCPKSMMG